MYEVSYNGKEKTFRYRFRAEEFCKQLESAKVECDLWYCDGGEVELLRVAIHNMFTGEMEVEELNPTTGELEKI